jgi:hypothetical protein
MLKSGVAIWSLEFQKLLPGPNFAPLINEIEEAKRISGGFHPHIARRVFSMILADWKLGHCLKIPETRKNKVWIVRLKVKRLMPLCPCELIQGNCLAERHCTQIKSAFVVFIDNIFSPYVNLTLLG